MIDALRLIGITFLSCGIAIWAARRWVRRFSRSSAALLLLLPLVLTGRAVFTGGCYGPVNLAYGAPPLASKAAALAGKSYDDAILSDISCSFIPWAKAVREAVKHGRVPLLNRFMLCGDILLATIQPGIFHPNTLLGFLLPLATALTFRCAFTFFLAGLFALLYFTELGVSEIVSFLGACGWAYCGFVLFWVGWNVSPAIVPLPLLLLGLRRLARGIPNGFGIVVTALLLSVFAGHPETLLHLVLVGGLLFCFDLLSSGNRLRAVGLAAAAGVLTLGMAAVSLLPFVEALRQTGDYMYRHSVYAHQQKSVSLAASLHGVFATFYPGTYGPMWSGGPGRPPDDLSYTAAFIGGLLFALVPVGLLSRRRERWPLTGALLLCAGVGYGFPVVADWVSRIPLLDISINIRLIGFAAFFLIALAVIGLEELTLRTSRAGPALLVGSSIIMLAVGAWSARHLPATAKNPQAFLLSVGLLGAPGLVLGVCARRLRRRPRRLVAAAIGLQLLFHLAEMPLLYPSFPARLFAPPVSEFERLPRGGEPYRVAGLGFNLIANQSALYELEDPRGYTSMSNARLLDTLLLWSLPQPVWFNRIDDPARPFIDFLNVRFAIAGPSAAPPRGWPVYLRGDDCSIFENPKVLPRAFAPRAVRFVSDFRKTPGEMGRCWDFAGISWIEDPSRAAGETANGPARVATREEGTDLRLTIEAAAPAWIVVSETNWKGWRAIENGRELPIHFANHAFVGFQVEAGRHEVLLRYWPRSFSLGLALSGLSIVVLIAGAAIRRTNLTPRPPLQLERGCPP